MERPWRFIHSPIPVRRSRARASNSPRPVGPTFSSRFPPLLTVSASMRTSWPTLFQVQAVVQDDLRLQLPHHAKQLLAAPVLAPLALPVLRAVTAVRVAEVE